MSRHQNRSLLLGASALALVLFGRAGAVEPEADKKPEPKKEQPKKEEPRLVPNIRLPQLDESFKQLEAVDPALAKELRQQMQDLQKDLNKMMQDVQKMAVPNWNGGPGNVPGNWAWRGNLNRGRLPFGRRSAEGELDIRLGARLEKPTPALVEQLELPKGQGLVVGTIAPDSAAAKAGLKANDILLELGNKPVTSDPGEFSRRLKEIKAGTPVDAVVLRKGKRETIKNLSLPEANTPKGEKEKP